MKPSLRENPNHFVLHIGKNDLNSDRSPELIAKSIADVGSSLKNDSHDVSISSAVVRNDKFKEKAAQGNKNLEKLCAEYIFHQSRKEYFTIALEQKQVISEQKR